MKKRSKMLVIAIPVILALSGLVFYEFGFFKIMAEYESIRDIQKVKMKTLEQSISLVSQKPQMEKRIAEMKEIRKAQGTKLIEGATASLATATLQSTVRALITSRGGSISSERVEKPEDLGKLKVIGISVDTTLPDSRALSNILYALETQVPYLIVRELDSRIVNTAKPKELLVKLKISALTGGR